MEDPHQSRFQAGPVAHGEETTQEQVTWQELLPVGDPGWSSLLLRDGPHGTDPYLEEFLKSLWEAHAGSVRQGLHPMGGTPRWSCSPCRGDHVGAVDLAGAAACGGPKFPALS